VSTVSKLISDLLDIEKHLQVLLAVRLEVEDVFRELYTLCDWLQNIPEGTKNVTIEGVYKSCSTLVLLRLPVVLWNPPPEHEAYSFIGLVGSRNLTPATLPGYPEPNSQAMKNSKSSTGISSGINVTAKAGHHFQDVAPEYHPSSNISKAPLVPPGSPEAAWKRLLSPEHVIINRDYESGYALFKDGHGKCFSPSIMDWRSRLTNKLKSRATLLGGRKLQLFWTLATALLYIESSGGLLLGYSFST